jgi:hypothetical protein
VAYFLHRNEEVGVSDVSSRNNWYVVPDVEEACNFSGVQMMKDIDRIT